MGIYRPLRGVLFVYELVRLAALVWVIGRAAPAEEGVVFPVLVYGVANVLFLLMALFVRLDPHRYGAYVPLYTAGKVISAVSALGWCVFSWERIINAFFINDPESFIWIVGGSLLFIAAGDILSACGGVALVRKLKLVEAAALQPIAVGPIAVEPKAGKPTLL